MCLYGSVCALVYAIVIQWWAVLHRLFYDVLHAKILKQQK
jgi:hypothetical protein